jgi:hypothetical protein
MPFFIRCRNWAQRELEAIAMSSPEERNAEYAKGREADASRNNNYTFGIIIDNRTDIHFDDSSFAWDYVDQGGGGMVSGHHWPALSAVRLNAPSGGCIKTVSGQLFYGGKRLPLSSFGPPPPNKCRAEVGWVIHYKGRELAVATIGDDIGVRDMD